MKSVFLLVPLLFTANAFAARQTISCTEITKAKSKHSIEASFDPSVVLSENWTKGKQGDEIVGYTLGKSDSNGETTARVTFKVPENSSVAGSYKFAGYYEVNHPEKAGGGYSSHFDGKAYRSTHGYDSKHFMDMMFYYPETVVGQNVSGFKALVTYQPGFVDEGYANVEMTCDSELK
jgi:hypothetical protein